MMNARLLRCVLAANATAGWLVAAAQKKQSDVTGTVQLNDDFSRVPPNWRTGKFSNGETWIEGGVLPRVETCSTTQWMELFEDCAEKFVVESNEFLQRGSII
jgi:hypothetical protein